MSFKAAHMVCKAVLHWAPANETIEQVVLGMGRDAAPFMQQLEAPRGDGEVLVIEVDGKCPPTATEAELAKRRGQRQSRHQKGCTCGCQRHRGQAKRQARGSKKRRKKGDKSKNGKEVSVVVTYTLKRDDDGKLHGPINKKVYATFAGRKAAALWARAEATKRGFGPDTTKTVQIVLDGAKGLQHNLQPLFPQAIFTLDVCHVIEKLWALGHHFHKEGSKELQAWVEELKTLVYAGKAKTLFKRLKKLLCQTPKPGPGNKGRRKALKTVLGYLKPRLDMMRYGEWIEQDLVIASGQVEGAVRHLVGERFDCSGMRWRREKAEALLLLRCIELNGDWQHFFAWTQKRIRRRLRKGKRVKVLTDQPLTLANTSWLYQKVEPPKEIKLHDIVTIVVDEKNQLISEGQVQRRRKAQYDAQLQNWVALDGLNLKAAAQADGDPREGDAGGRDRVEPLGDEQERRAPDDAGHADQQPVGHTSGYLATDQSRPSFSRYR
jgi:hypothetical protein